MFRAPNFVSDLLKVNDSVGVPTRISAVIEALRYEC